MKVAVRERGSVSLSEPQWRAISGDNGFQDLVSRAVLSSEPDRTAAGWRLKAAGFVGRTFLGGIEIEIVEKIPGAFVSMAAILAPRAYKLARAASPALLGRPPQAILAEMFVIAARSYLSGYSLSEYVTENDSGAYVVGRLDVPRTIGLRARGTRHRVAFRRTRLSDNLSLNRVIYRALGEISSIDAEAAIGSETSATARALRASFGDSAVSSASLSKKDVIKEAVEQTEIAIRPPAINEVAGLALAILQGAAPSDGSPREAIMPRSWFVNLENLFERVLRVCVNDALIGISSVGGSNKNSPLLLGHPVRYPANPDIIITDSQNVVILDAKYKDRVADPDASDIYQLYAHASACGAIMAGLMYPADRPVDPAFLGISTSGISIWSFGIDLSQPRNSVATALRTMGFPL